jgi:hypothetical protein
MQRDRESTTIRPFLTTPPEFACGKASQAGYCRTDF